MSHEIEPPAPSPGPPSSTRAGPSAVDEEMPLRRVLPERPPDSATRPHVMSPGTPHIQRPQTIAGIGTLAPPPILIPPPPLTEVVPAPDVRPEPASLPESLPEVGASAVPRPRPSETVMGSRGPLHTAEEANTGVDITTLSADDADRILAAAEAQGPKGPGAVVSSRSPSGLPPPPPLRRSSFPPPAAPHVDAGHPRPPQNTTMLAFGAPRAAPPVPVLGLRSSFPPPPRRAKTLLYAEGPPVNAVPTDSKGSIRALLSRHAVSEPKPAGAVDTLPPMRPRMPSLEELSSGLLVDDGSDVKVIPPPPALPPPPQPISSSSLVEDPDSDPDLALEEDRPPLAAFPPTPFVPIPEGHAPVAMNAPDAPVQLHTARMEVVPLPGFASPAPSGEGEVEPSPETVRTQPPAARVPPQVRGATPAADRPAWVVPVAIFGGAASLAAFVGVVALGIKWVHASLTSSAAPELAASAEPFTPIDSRGSVAPTTTASTPHRPVAEPSTGAPCVLAGAPHIIAPHALLKTGLEVASSDDRIALGVALSDHEAFVVSLETRIDKAAALHPNPGRRMFQRPRDPLT